MGRPKALLELDGEPLVERLAHVYCAFAETLIVASEPLKQQLSALSLPSNARIVDGAPGGQMIESLACALDGITEDRAGAMIQPIDAPFTSSAMLDRLLAGAVDRPRVLAFEGRPGHPVWVPRRLFPEILALPRGGLRALIGPRGTHPAQLLAWPSDEILADLDTPEDYARALARKMRPPD